MPDQSQSPPAPLQQITLTKDDLTDPSLLNNQLTNIVQMLNYILGHGGEPPYLKAGANFGGQAVKNVGAPSDDGDVVPYGFATSTFGAAALAPAFSSLGKQVMQSYRRLSDTNQREQYSSFLNDTQSTPPTANTATLSATVVGGSVDVTVSSGLHQRVDGSSVPFMSRTDSLPLSASFSISSISRSGNIVTATLTSTFTGINGDQINVGGTGDSSFQGTFIVATGAGTSTITWAQVGPNASSSGGTVALVGIWYYTISKGQNQLGLIASPSADTWSNRVQSGASFDGTTIIAVVAVNNLGLDPVNSAGGATPPQSGAVIPVIRRL
jgi:hypothetical protein